MKKINSFKNKNEIQCLILPGSRKKEIFYNIDVLFMTVIKINKFYDYKIKWLLPSLEHLKDYIYKKIELYKLQNCIDIVNFDKSLHKIVGSRVAISCSGTVTLQLSLLSIPTIVIYKTSFLNGIIGKILVNLDNVVLSNFIVKKKIVPFLFQNRCNVNNLFILFQEFFDNHLEYKNRFSKLSIDLKQQIFKSKKGLIII